MAKPKLLVHHIEVDNEKVSKLYVDYKGESYYATINNSKISIEALYKSIGIYDRTRKIMRWYHEHVCGATGFGQSLSDSCPACNSPDGSTESYKGKRISDFSEMDEIMHPASLPLAIDELCSRIEKDLPSSVKPVADQLQIQKTIKPMRAQYLIKIK